MTRLKIVSSYFLIVSNEKEIFLISPYNWVNKTNCFTKYHAIGGIWVFRTILNDKYQLSSHLLTKLLHKHFCKFKVIEIKYGYINQCKMNFYLWFHNMYANILFKRKLIQLNSIIKLMILTVTPTFYAKIFQRQP